MKDPIQPKKYLTKKPNFKNEKLDTIIRLIPPVWNFATNHRGLQRPTIIRTQDEMTRMFGSTGHPISSRSRIHDDGSVEFLSYDLVVEQEVIVTPQSFTYLWNQNHLNNAVPNPPTPRDVLGGESMSFDASFTLDLTKKSTINRIKNYIINLYRRFF
jgi:hypothetical protein